MILRGYIDESYSSKIFTLSCLMSDPPGWLGIEWGWKNCISAKNKPLKAQGRRLISRYHAADCSSCHGDFEDWTKDEQIQFAKELLAVFRRGKNWVNVISYSMPLDDFVKEFPEYSDDRIGFCYSELMKFLMLEMVEQVMEKKRSYGNTRTKPVQFVLFHDRGPFDGLLLNSFKAMLGDTTFAGETCFQLLRRCRHTAACRFKVQIYWPMKTSRRQNATFAIENGARL